MDIPVDNGYRQMMKERKLMNCDNDRRTKIMRSGGIRSKRYGSRGNI